MLKKIGIVIGGLFLAVVIFFVFFLIAIYNKVVVRTTVGKIPFLQNTTPTPTPDPFAPYAVLLLGYGGPKHDGGYLTDTMIVAYIIPKKETVYLISIPRDVWVSLPIYKGSSEHFKINASYAIGRDDRRYNEKPAEYTGKGGGGALSKHSAEIVTGLPIQYFIAVSFDGFKKSIDTLGGVDVNIPHTFDDFLYPIEEEKENACGKSEQEVEEVTATLSGTLLEKEFPCRYKHVHFDGGIQHLDGGTALELVRSRKSEQHGGDYNRSLRQQALLKAVKEKIISLNFIPKIVPFISTITSDMQTDIDAGVFKAKLKVHPNIASFQIKTVTLDGAILKEDRSADGQYILIAPEGIDQWESIHSYIQSQIAAE